MCEVGRLDLLYQKKNQQAQRNIMAEQQQPQQQQVDQQVQEQAVVYEHVRIDSSYSNFRQRLEPLPKTPVAGNQPPAEEKVGWKERKRRKALYKEQYKMREKDFKENPDLVTEDYLKKMFIFQTKLGREQWENEKLPHSKLTRGQTMHMIIDEGDYSNFENLDVLMRNRVATMALNNFEVTFAITIESKANDIISDLKARAKGVSPFLDPALRLGFSLAQRSRSVPSWKKKLYRELDEAMSTEVMEATLTHVPDQAQVTNYFTKKKSKDPEKDAEKAIAANKAQQIQIAKRLLLMQLSFFNKITKDANGAVTETAWDKSMAVALSHCSRVVLTLPKLDAGESNAQQQQRMWNAIYTINGNNDAQDNSRTSSTHNIERRKVSRDDTDLKRRGKLTSKEKKVLFNFSGQRGMNCAIGGLGNSGISGNTLSNDGSCGHFYSMYKEADAENYGTMLMGLESDAAGVMNQMGHTHDIHATPEKASSLGGQRTDEEGEKYGGRQCDLTRRSAKSITDWMILLEDAMLSWQEQTGGMESADAKLAMKMLAGKQMNFQELLFFRDKLKSAKAQLTPH